MENRERHWCSGVFRRVLGCLEALREPRASDRKELAARLERVREMGGVFSGIAISDHLTIGRQARERASLRSPTTVRRSTRVRSHSSIF